MKQDQYYLDNEADAFFQRNFSNFSAEELLAGGPLRPNKQSILDRLETRVNLKGLRVLEIGCAVGDLLFALRERHSCSVRGIEPSKDASRISRDILALDIEVATLSMSTLYSIEPDNAGKFDLVILDDVVGWMDPAGVAQAFAVIDWILSPSGYIFIREFWNTFPYKVSNHHHPGEEIFNYRYPDGFSSFFLRTGNYAARYQVVEVDHSLQKVRAAETYSSWKDTILQKSQSNLFPVVAL